MLQISAESRLVLLTYILHLTTLHNPSLYMSFRRNLFKIKNRPVYEDFTFHLERFLFKSTFKYHFELSLKGKQNSLQNQKMPIRIGCCNQLFFLFPAHVFNFFFSANRLIDVHAIFIVHQFITIIFSSKVLIISSMFIMLRQSPP